MLAIRDSTLTAVLMPSPTDCLLVLDDQATDVVQLSRTGNVRHVALALGRMISGSDDSAKSG
jgi:hypothetical protein